MDTRLLAYYNRELRFLREAGGEFAEAYPRIAARLSLGSTPCPDPYVERLIEACAFLAARVQLKLDARHSAFTDQLFEAVYPGFLAPIPAAVVADFVPDHKEGSLLSGVQLPRGTELRTVIGKGERTPCQFRTTRALTLWPLRLAEARYVPGGSSLASWQLPGRPPGRAALRMRLEAPEGISVASLPLDDLTFYLAAPTGIASMLAEQLLARTCGAAVLGSGPDTPVTVLPPESIAHDGLEDHESLLPAPSGGFQGYRLLQEYFALPERLLFFRVSGLRRAIAGLRGRDLVIYILFDRLQPMLENAVEANHIRLYATPAVNLFEREIDRLRYDPAETEQHVVADRNRPMDYEVHSLLRVRGVGDGSEILNEILPMHRLNHRIAGGSARAFYAVQRRPRLASSGHRTAGTRTQYAGSEVFLSIYDGQHRHLSGSLRQLDIRALCTNRDLALGLQPGRGRTDFIAEGNAPIESVRCLVGPTRPRASATFGDTAWRLISQLSLNHLSISQAPEGQAIAMLTDMLAAHADPDDAASIRQLEGIRNVSYRPVVRRLPLPGPITYGRGIAIELEIDEASFEGTGPLLLGAVLERFFARYASINSFTQTVLRSTARGQLMQWPVRSGTRQLL